jgi:hypothetical protein
VNNDNKPSGDSHAPPKAARPASWRPVEDDERTVSTDVPVFDALHDVPSPTSSSSYPPSTQKEAAPPGSLPMLETTQPASLRTLTRTMMGIAPQAAPRPSAASSAPSSRASVAVSSSPSDSAAYRGNRYVDPCEATTIAPTLGPHSAGVGGADVAAVDAATLIVPVGTHAASSDLTGSAPPRVFAWGREPDPSAEVDPQIVSNEQFDASSNQASQAWAPAQGGTVPMPPLGAGYGGSVAHGGSAFGGVPAPGNLQNMQGTQAEFAPGARAAPMSPMQLASPANSASYASQGTWGDNAQQPVHLSRASWGPQPPAPTASPESVRGSKSMFGFVVFVVLCLAIFLTGAVLFLSTKC